MEYPGQGSSQGFHGTAQCASSKSREPHRPRARGNGDTDDIVEELLPPNRHNGHHDNFSSSGDFLLDRGGDNATPAYPPKNAVMMCEMIRSSNSTLSYITTSCIFPMNG